MSTEESIIQRLESLEKQNRQLKRIGAVLILITAALFLMGQTAGKRSVEANEFVLRDGKGTVRSKWFMEGNGPRLSFLNPEGQETVFIKVLDYADGNSSGTMEFYNPDASLTLHGPIGKTIGPLIGLVHGGSVIRISEALSYQNPMIQVEDKDGYSATLGHAELISPKTGETRKTSAASLTFFDKEQHVIWQAP